MAEQDKYKVPPGFRTLLEALSREVLRAQPSDIYRFSHLFFQQLLRQRAAHPGVSVLEDAAAYEVFKADLRAKYETGEYLCGDGNNSEEKTFVNGRAELERPKSPLDDAATKIQAAFRGFQVRTHPEQYGLDSEAAAMSSGRRHSNELLNIADTKKDIKRHSVGGYDRSFYTPEDKAAMKIQAEIRGFLTRRKVSSMKQENDHAAKKIQSHIRGYLTRKHLHEQGLSPKSWSQSSLRSSQSAEQLLKLNEQDKEDIAATKIQAQIKG